MQTSPTPRKPLLAAFMSFMLPGFGQLYNGEVNKAIWLFLAFGLLAVLGPAVIALYMPAAMMMATLLLGVGLGLGLWAFGIWDAARSARRLQTYVVAGWQLPAVYTLTFLLCAGLALPALMSYVRAHEVESFSIPSSSMLPTLLPGDVLSADKRYNCPECKSAIARGDVAIFVYPNNRTQHFIKRIIGLPGDHVKLQGHKLWINDQALTQSEADNRVTEAIDGHQWQVQWTKPETTDGFDLTVPPGQALVLGDNRDISVDTRNFGTVPLADVVARAQQIWFSHSMEDGLRWARLGKLVQ